MKRIAIIHTALLILLCVSVTLANPVMPGFINELYFQSGSWVLEMDKYLPIANLDGWTISSRAGSSQFKSGIMVGNNLYKLLTPDSLMTPLAIDPAGDSIVVNGPNGSRAQLVFGKTGYPGCSVQPPTPGWSISYKGFFYLDKSPTLGAANDGTGAMATVTGAVRDSVTGAPLPNALVEEWVSETWHYTSDSGKFVMPLYANNQWLAVSLKGYHSRTVVFSLLPDQVVDTVVYLSSVTSVAGSEIPQTTLLLDNYPNPFNSSTVIAFTQPAAGKVTLTLYDALGREVAELVRGFRPPGEYRVTWNGTDENGRSLGSGIYLARLRVNEGNAGLTRERTVKLLLIR